MSDTPLLVITNLPDADQARSLARMLVESRLAACVNVLPPVGAVYRWEGTIESAQEVPLHIKTVASRYEALEQAIRIAHPYEVPEIIALPITRGFAGYLEWVARETETG